jgi:putative FmdB family regulatory protein
MPTYDYVCDACKHEFEEFQSMSEDHLTKCPECGKKKLRRLIGSGAAVLFKGSGFYETDYRSDSYKAAAKADAEKPADTSSKKDSNGTAGTNGTAGKGEKKAGGGGKKSAKSSE